MSVLPIYIATLYHEVQLTQGFFTVNFNQKAIMENAK